MARRRAQNGTPTHEIEHHRLRLDRIHQNRYPVQQPCPALRVKIHEPSDFLWNVAKSVPVAINFTSFEAGAMDVQPVGRQRDPFFVVDCQGRRQNIPVGRSKSVPPERSLASVNVRASCSGEVSQRQAGSRLGG